MVGTLHPYFLILMTLTTAILVTALICSFGILLVLLRVLWRLYTQSRVPRLEATLPPELRSEISHPRRAPVAPVSIGSSVKPSMRDIYVRPAVATHQAAPSRKPASRWLAKTVQALVLVLFCVLIVKVGFVASQSGSHPQETTAPVQQPWYDQAWPYRLEVTVNHSFVEENVRDFPVMVHLDADSPLFAHSTTGQDIMFTAADGVTKLAHEIESYDATAHQLVAWVKVPQLSVTEDTVLYLYYGAPSAPDQSQAAAVWTNGYAGVYHVTNASAVQPLIDSTKPVNDVNRRITYGDAMIVPGKISGALDFQKNAAVADLGNTNDSERPRQAQLPLTLSAWVKPSALAGTIVGKRNSATTAWQFFTDGQGYLYIKEDETGRWPGHQSAGTAATRLFLNQWQYVAVSIDEAGTPTFFNDGVSEPGSHARGVFRDHPINASIGARWSYYPSTDYQFRGSIDSIRLATVVRSAGWLRTEQANQAYPAAFSIVASQPQTSQNSPARAETANTPTSSPTITVIKKNPPVRERNVRLLHRFAWW